jgi:2-dehydropantoate 2-reductase
MKILCFGAGAIGTYVGGSLQHSGNQVVFVERPEIASFLQKKGLRIVLPEGEKIIKNPIIASSYEEAMMLGPFDVAVLAVKSFDTQPLLEKLLPYKGILPPFLCLQNGVENEGLIAELLGWERVIPGTVTSAIGRNDLGDVVLEKLRGIGIYSNHSLSNNLLNILNQADLSAHLFSNFQSMKWSKMLTNLMGNATSAILSMTPGEVFGNRAGYKIEVLQLREAMRVMAAQQIPVSNIPGTPVVAISWLVRYFPELISRPILRSGIGKGRGDKMPSFFIDLHSGKKNSEVEYLNGAVVRFGKKFRIKTPVNGLLNQTLLDLTKDVLPKKTYFHQPVKLLRVLSNIKDA